MGRAYAGELETLSKTYDWAVRTSVNDISAFVKRSASLPQKAPAIMEPREKTEKIQAASEMPPPNSRTRKGMDGIRRAIPVT